MPQGLEVYNASGVLEMAVTDRLTRIIGETTATGGTAGSVTNAGLATGSPFWWVSRDSSSFYSIEPSITVSGDTLSWTWPISTTGSFTIIYGVY